MVIKNKQRLIHITPKAINEQLRNFIQICIDDIFSTEAISNFSGKLQQQALSKQQQNFWQPPLHIQRSNQHSRI